MASQSDRKKGWIEALVVIARHGYYMLLCVPDFRTDRDPHEHDEQAGAGAA